MTTCIAPGCREAREVGALFCKKDLAAPSGKRGGWISAWRRAQARANAPQPLDASNIVKRLWVGSAPPFDRDLPDFDVLALCAIEVQPQTLAFSKRVIRVPIHDSVPTKQEAELAIGAGRAVASELAAGRRVLVTCRAGLNRSALIASIALAQLTRMPAIKIIELMRTRRAPAALGNPHFCALLHSVTRK